MSLITVMTAMALVCCDDTKGCGDYDDNDDICNYDARVVCINDHNNNIGNIGSDENDDTVSLVIMMAMMTLMIMVTR